MGVQGLVTLLDSHRQIYREVRFRKSRLVIDGCNLLYLLYFSSGLDQNHGGEYAAFEDLIEQFITTLRGCGITPHMVLDGDFDFSKKKCVTQALRTEDRLRRAHQAAVGGRNEDSRNEDSRNEDSRNKDSRNKDSRNEGGSNVGSSNENVLPVLALLVFKQTLARLEVPVAQCYGEADQEIASLASEWQCPVLSNDSDFYIFELPAGLLPISHFKWEEVKQSGSQRYIPCLSYKTSSFCIFFGIQPELLPTFAALAGNDYVKLQWMGSSINWAQFAPADSKRPKHLEGLLCWLRGFKQPGEALKAVLGTMGELSREKKMQVGKALWMGMQEYKLPPSTLKKFFIHRVPPSFPVMAKVAARVPDWMCLSLTQARLSGDFLNVLLLHQSRSLSLTVDHSDMPCACLTSRPLRQVMYGLLLGGGKSILVAEPERDGLELKLTRVQPTFNGVIRRLPLNALDKAELSERLQVMLEALGVTEESLKHLPPHLRLPVAVTCYWLQKADPPPDMTLVKALLLGLSNGETLRQRAALQTQIKHYKPKLDMVMAHSFNQWLVCLKDSIHLNQLLGCPLPEPQIARLYEGTLVHQLAHTIRTEERLKSLPKNDCSSVKQYETMLSVIHQFHIQEMSTSSETQNKVAAPQLQPLDDLTTNPQQLLLKYEDEEAVTEVKSMVRAQEDLHLHDLLSVRTRYRSKERNRCNKPELARKEERRGWDLL